ncbi:MAG TPA: DsbA family protein [Gemmatimonadaceae bacterium]|nr:DsbA family protein [Gemmatimonadaceae bacterium]
MDYTLYTDFTTVECFGLNEQLIALGITDLVHWRGVQHEPSLPAPMKPLDRRAMNQLEDEIEDVRRRVDGIAIALPRGRPNSARAIVAAASVARALPSRAAPFRDALYRAYWRVGADLSEMAVLHRVADAVGVPRAVELDDPDAADIVENWELDWATERLGGVPRVIRGDGKILWGLRPRGEIAAFFGLA